MYNKKTYIAIILSLSTTQCFSSYAFSEKSDSGNISIEEIVVTSRLRKESIQDVPLSITAFSSDELKRSGIKDLTDISNATAGFNFEAYAGGGFPAATIRGLSATNILAFESNVAFFFGGVYLPKAYMSDLGVAGIERVEIVKGPQSALYGRNAFSGAVNYVPVTPPEELTIDAFLTYGANERFEAGATIGAPIIEDRVSFIAGFAHTQFDGTWDNNHPNAKIGTGSKDKLGGYDHQTYFAALELKPVDRLEITLGYNRWERENEQQGKSGIRRNNGGTNCSVGSDGVLQFFCGTLDTASNIAVDPRATGLVATHELFRAEAKYQINDQLSLNYRFGYVDSDSYQFDATVVDQINGDVPALGVKFIVTPLGGIDGGSHDVRLDYEDNDTTFSVGLYQQRLDDENSLWATFPDAFRSERPALGNDDFSADNLGDGLNILVTDQDTQVRNQSVFAQFSQDFFNDEVNLSAEGRYTEERKIQFNAISEQEDRATFSFFTPRVTLTWNHSPQRNVYISAARGAKSGGFNGGGLPSENTFQPETNWTYELGSKNAFLDGRLILNGSLFYVDWSSLQTLGQSADPDFIGTITRNIGAADSKGFELDLTAFVSEGLRFTGSAAYNDASWKDGQVDPTFLLIRNASNIFIDACDNVVCPSDGSIGGNTLVRQSKWHASGGIRYDSALSVIHNADFWVGANINYKSHQFVDNMNLTKIPSRTLVNFNTGVGLGNASLEFWARNVFDNKYVSSSLFNLSPPGEIRYTPTYGERRTFGVTLRYKM